MRIHFKFSIFILIVFQVDAFSFYLLILFLKTVLAALILSLNPQTSNPPINIILTHIAAKTTIFHFFCLFFLCLNIETLAGKGFCFYS